MTNGSRGDIQPYVALARALMEETDFKVAIVSHAEFEEFVQLNAPGCGFFPLDGSPTKMLRDERFKEAFFNGSASEQLAIVKEFMAIQKENKQKTYDAAKAFCASFIIGTITTQPECSATGSRLGVPVVTCCTFPVHPTKEFVVGTMTADKDYSDNVNRLLGWVGEKVMWNMQKDEINTWRASLSLRPLNSFEWAPCPHINLYSPLVQPRPQDWPGYVYDTGYWIMKSEKFVPPQELASFLAAGPPPVYLGFGSMPAPKNVRSMFVKVCAALKIRGIFCQGWSEVEGEELDEESRKIVLQIPGAPHEWLFPKCAAAIHHGGAGTTAATLR